MKQKIISFGGPPQVQAARPKGGRKTPRRKRRAGRQTLSYLLLIIVAAAIMMTLSLTVFFKVESIQVEGITKYAPQQIQETSEIQIGDNLFRVNEKTVIKKLKETYPYIEEATLKRVFPGKLVIDAIQAKPLGACDTASGYVVVSESGRVLEIGAKTIPDDIMVVTGMYFYEPVIGRMLGTGYTEEQKAVAELEAEGFDMLKQLVEAVSEIGFKNISMVDFSDPLNIMIVYGDRIIIELGSQGDLPYKLHFVETIIEEIQKQNFQGTLDASMAKTSGVRTIPGDVPAELERRKLTVSQELDGAMSQEGEDVPQSLEFAHPDLEVIPGTGKENASSAVSSVASSKSASSTSSSSAPTQSGENTGGPAVIPGAVHKGWKPQNSASTSSDSSSQSTQSELEDGLEVVQNSLPVPID